MGQGICVRVLVVRRVRTELDVCLVGEQTRCFLPPPNHPYPPPHHPAPRLLIVQQQRLVVALERVAHARHAVGGREVAHAREHLALQGRNMIVKHGRVGEVR